MPAEQTRNRSRGKKERRRKRGQHPGRRWQPTTHYGLPTGWHTQAALRCLVSRDNVPGEPEESIKTIMMMLMQWWVRSLCSWCLLADNDFDDVYDLSSNRFCCSRPSAISISSFVFFFVVLLATCLSAGKCVNKKMLTAIFYTISGCRCSLCTRSVLMGSWVWVPAKRFAHFRLLIYQNYYILPIWQGKHNLL